MNKKAQGFTIVELLIVIVVIAILAAISIAAYTNIQQRAKNTAIINAASQSLKMIQAYIAANGTYPVTWSACVTMDSGCQTTDSGGGIIAVTESPTFRTNMATVGVLPKSTPSESGSPYGVSYFYSATYQFDDESRPAYLRYYLLGKDRQCGLPGVMKWAATGIYTSSSNGYTSLNDTFTTCWISIPGPAHS